MPKHILESLMTTEDQVKPYSAKSGIGLRPILQAMLVTIVILTAGVIAGLVNFEAREALSQLAESQFRMAAQGATAKVNEHLRSVPQGLREIDFLVDNYDLSLSKHGDIKAHLLTLAVAYPSGTLVGYGSNEGSTYILVRRGETGATIVENSNSEIHRGGGTAIASGDYRDSKWFRRGLSAEIPHWTKTYVFTDGRVGVSAVLAHHGTKSAAPTGVFHVDIPLAAMEEWLGNINIARKGYVFLVHHDNTIAAEPRIEGKLDPSFDALLKIGMANLNRVQGALGTGEIESIGFVHQKQEYNIAIIGADVIEGLDWQVGILVPEEDILRLANKRMTSAVFFAGGVAVFVIFLGAVFASRLAGPLRDVTHQLGDAAKLRIADAQPSTSMVREVATLSEALGAMKSGLQSLERYVPPEVARRLVTGGTAAAIGVEERRLSIFVSDIEGFTGITETLETNRLVEELNAYFNDMTAAIRAREGTIDKFMGDGILAFFNAPQDVPDHAAHSCHAALVSVAMTEAAVANRIAAGRPVFRIRVGLAVGQVLVGNVGSSDRFGYTVIGDTVNVATRLESVNKAYGTRIIASDELRGEAGDGFEWRRLDRIAVAGRKGGLPISELLGLVSEVGANCLVRRDQYEAALDAYLAGDFKAAAGGFSALAASDPRDNAAGMMAVRATELAEAPTPEYWDGVYVFRTK
jgi:adenylate cyclase